MSVLRLRCMSTSNIFQNFTTVIKLHAFADALVKTSATELECEQDHEYFCSFVLSQHRDHELSPSVQVSGLFLLL